MRATGRQPTARTTRPAKLGRKPRRSPGQSEQPVQSSIAGCLAYNGIRTVASSRTTSPLEKRCFQTGERSSWARRLPKGGSANSTLQSGKTSDSAKSAAFAHPNELGKDSLTGKLPANLSIERRSQFSQGCRRLAEPVGCGLLIAIEFGKYTAFALVQWFETGLNLMNDFIKSRNGGRRETS